MSNVKIGIMIGPRIGHFSCDRLSIFSGKNIVHSCIRAFFHELTPVVPVDITGDHIAEIEKALAELTKLIAKLKQNHAEQESI